MHSTRLERRDERRRWRREVVFGGRGWSVEANTWKDAHLEVRFLPRIGCFLVLNVNSFTLAVGGLYAITDLWKAPSESIEDTSASDLGRAGGFICSMVTICDTCLLNMRELFELPVLWLPIVSILALRFADDVWNWRMGIKNDCVSTSDRVPRVASSVQARH